MITKPALQGEIRRHAPKDIPVFLGLDSGLITKHWGGDYLYIDHAYYSRGWDRNNFRLVRNAPHLTRVIKHSADRLAKFKVTLKPYRSGGRHIVVVVPGRWMADTYKKPGIAYEMAEECKKYTDRPIHIKIKKGPELAELLKDAWAVICPFSVAGVEAAVAGYPVFSTPLCPSWPINAGTLADIENPQLPERYEWANSLAWATWHTDEIKSINFEEYQCV